MPDNQDRQLPTRCGRHSSGINGYPGLRSPRRVIGFVAQFRFGDQRGVISAPTMVVVRDYVRHAGLRSVLLESMVVMWAEARVS
jgi:hypothetical protein